MTMANHYIHTCRFLCCLLGHDLFYLPHLSTSSQCHPLHSLIFLVIAFSTLAETYFHLAVGNVAIADRLQFFALKAQGYLCYCHVTRQGRVPKAQDAE
jgi:hypothetical protein